MGMINLSAKKAISIIFMLAVCAHSSFAQPERPQNIYRVTVNSRYVIENGERTSKYFAINQEISDSLGRMHTEIDFDWETHYPKNYRWHYFNGMQKVKTDFFINEKLSRIEEYTFNNNRLASLTQYAVSENDTSFLIKEVYTYDSNNRIVKAEGYNAKGKRGYRAKLKYDEHGNEIYRKVKGKRLTPPDSIILLEKNVEYDSLNRISKEVVTINTADKGSTTKAFAYTYTDEGRIAERRIMGSNGKLQKREELTYRKDGRIQQKKIFNENENLIDHLAWRYEIYKTSDRRHRTFE